jgi:PKD repeat protein
MILLSPTALAVPQTNLNTGTILKAPVAAFAAHPTSGNVPLKVEFIDKSTGAHSYKWSFGDGKSSTEKNPEHIYTTVGKYTVSLTVRNAAGNNTTTKSNLIVVNPMKVPVAAFAAHPTSGEAPLNVASLTRVQDSSLHISGVLEMGLIQT